MGADGFLQLLQKILRAHPAGLSEFELIRQLRAAGETAFDDNCLQDNLSLFQTHFFLFHSLYRLSDQLAQAGEWQLQISALCIQLRPCSKQAGQQIAHHDPLREYYLDLEQLENTDAEQVEVLLAQFWQLFLRNDQRRAALDTLQLQDPVDWRTIKQRYRALAMQHHPDRGGDSERLQAINAAMDLLARSHRRERRDAGE